MSCFASNEINSNNTLYNLPCMIYEDLNTIIG